VVAACRFLITAQTEVAESQSDIRQSCCILERLRQLVVTSKHVRARGRRDGHRVKEGLRAAVRQHHGHGRRQRRRSAKSAAEFHSMWLRARRSLPGVDAVGRNADYASVSQKEGGPRLK
jgi:hypothetical protein